MKTLTVFLVAFAFGCSQGYLIKVPTAIPTPDRSVIAPAGLVHLQKLILPLFENVCEESNNPNIIKFAQEFAQNPLSDDYLNPEAITNLQNLKPGKGFLAKGEIFTEFNADHLNELKIIHDVLYNAKDFDTFYKAAAWARQNINCGLYVNAIYLAMENRKDTGRLIIPAPYELLPNYFIRKDIIIQGSSLLAEEETTQSEGVHNEGNAYTLDANYTSNIYDNDDESKLAYFREDIGLNSYYFLSMLKHAPWLNNDINSTYGENLYHMMKQLMARYNLERYSNGLPELESLSWDSVTDAPYDPMLIYSNGNEFIHRTSPVNLPENEDKTLLQTIESNIGTVVSHMRDGGYNKSQILNHLMEILVTSQRSYDSLARHLLGKDLSNNGHLSVLEHYLTTLRDPIFWKLNKKIVDMVDSALNLLSPYSRYELYFPGVEIVNVDVKKIMANFDYFDFDITEALKIGNGDSTFQVKIGQPRLNHKSFTIKLNISSLVTQKGLVKIYLGPKTLPGEFARKKNLFVLLDNFEINLKMGTNIVSRTSEDMKQYSTDFISLRTLRKKVEDAEFGLDSLPLTTVESQIGYPSRLLIPRGTSDGLPLQLFVFVAPLLKVPRGGMYPVSGMNINTAIFSPLYPLDLPLDDKLLFEIPNAIIKDITVTHKGVNKVDNYGGSGVSKKLYDASTNENSRPSYNPNIREPFDYSSKKSQYENRVTGDNYNVVKDLDINEQNQAYVEPLDEKYNKLTSSGFDYSSKRFDYKTNKQIRKFDYKNIDKHDKNLTDNTDDELADKVIPIEDILHEDKEKDVAVATNDVREIQNNELLNSNKEDYKNSEYHLNVKPLLKLAAPKKRFIYDYIFGI